MDTETKQCQNCKKDFTIEPDDFAFYEKIKVPTPTFCLYSNTAAHFHDDSHCPNEFITSYAPDRPEIVYCEKCYQQEVV